MKQHNVDAVLDCLNREKIRCTFGAVAEVALRKSRAGVAVRHYLGNPRPRTAWVVRAKDGHPPNYPAEQKDPELYCSDEIIRTGEDLLKRFPELRKNLRAPPTTNERN